MARYGQLSLMLALALCALSEANAETDATAATNDISQVQKNLQEIAPGIFQIGTVRLDKNQKAVAFPATVNMDKGMVEYFIVNSVGKLHESVLRTDTEPVHIHVAMLLLGAKTETNVIRNVDQELDGEKIVMSVTWTNSGKKQTLRAEDLVFNTSTGAPMTRGRWTYNGSQVIDGTFIVQRDGSIASIISDPLALINNPRPGREDDEIWQVNTNAVPPLQTAVELSIQFERKN